MRRSVMRLVWIALSLAFLTPSAAEAWWKEPHQFIGGLTRIRNLPAEDQAIFEECNSNKVIQSGLVAPDVRRDQAFLLWKLGYAISHQADSVERAGQAHAHAARKYAAAREAGDLQGCCEAIAQLSEAIHYLQDSLDPTKELNPCRNQLAREISKRIVYDFSPQDPYWHRLRAFREKAKPEIDKISGGAEGIARVLKANRINIARQLNAVFDIYGNPPDCKIEEMDPKLYEAIVQQMIRTFGIMWAAQDRYLELATTAAPATAPAPPRNCRDVCVEQKTKVVNVTDGRHGLCGGKAGQAWSGAIFVTCKEYTECVRWEKQCD